MKNTELGRLITLAWRNKAHKILCLNDTCRDYQVLPKMFTFLKVKISKTYHETDSLRESGAWNLIHVIALVMITYQMVPKFKHID